ncbi:hypothetical protein L1987_55418 [Smallanthus sonchifolius]|uniref:Uncharacterized protein n=1 Tax=Smallanthus sonchifolius TaxID=185202 RepID=A0ACB9E9M1_9ASTR|nr:hypothetical protein L1987_55418 [Smallanthus sonchifolius]
MEDVLTENIMFDVLSRLPFKTLIYCKCVCKKWRDLVSDLYFVHLHHSKSPQCLLIHQYRVIEWVDIEQEVDHQRLTLNHVKSLNLNFCKGSFGYPRIQVGSVNGLICVCHPYYAPYIFNPVVGEYMFIPKPRSNLVSLSYGFGVSTAGEYKVIRICCNTISIEIEVYTLGTWKWRHLRQAPCNLESIRHGLFLNGHVYWIAKGQIYDFDLNTETFELFPSPPGDNEESKQVLGVLKGRLSRFSWSSLGLTVWVMKECWCKAIAMIQENINPFLKSQECGPMCLIDDGLKGVGILIIRMADEVVAYCLNMNMILHLNFSCLLNTIMTYRPSFLKLENVGSEYVEIKDYKLQIKPKNTKKVIIFNRRA